MKYKSKLIKEFFEKGKVEDCPIIDMHGHMGPFYGANYSYNTPEKMVNEMDRVGVKMLVFCHHGTLMSPDIGNAPSIEAVRKFPNRLRAYCGVNPHFSDVVKKEIKSFKKYSDVYVGFKFLPPYQEASLLHEGYKPVLEFADDNELLILTHTWGYRDNCGPKPVRKLLEKYHKIKLLIGHSFHDEWDAAIEIAKDFKNVYLELTAVLDNRGVLESFVENVGSQRIVFGTDYPWFDHHYYIGSVLGADITDEDRKNILYRNAEKLLKPFIKK